MKLPTALSGRACCRYFTSRFAYIVYTSFKYVVFRMEEHKFSPECCYSQAFKSSLKDLFHGSGSTTVICLLAFASVRRNGRCTSSSEYHPALISVTKIAQWLDIGFSPSTPSTSLQIIEVEACYGTGFYDVHSRNLGSGVQNGAHAMQIQICIGGRIT